MLYSYVFHEELLKHGAVHEPLFEPPYSVMYTLWCYYGYQMILHKYKLYQSNQKQGYGRSLGHTSEDVVHRFTLEHPRHMLNCCAVCMDLLLG